MTAPVEPKVKNATVAATLAAGVTAAVLSFADRHVPGLHDFLTNGAVVGTMTAVVAGTATFATGYITRHLPRGLTEDVLTELHGGVKEVPLVSEHPENQGP